jgi:hypothetical protein
MILISWDIGIKTLAYSIIDFNLLNNNINILYWNIINLISNDNKCYINNCKKKCIRYCKYYNTYIYFCKKHDTIYNFLQKIPSSNFHLTKQYIIKHINCNNYDINTLRKTLINKLDSIIFPLIFFYKIKYIIIENQPSLKNPKMKSIADTLYTWCLIRGIIDNNIINSINFINPINKLKEFKIIYETNNKYKTTKLKSIEIITNNFINNNKNLLLYLNNFKKKDDLCDSLLQGIYWINKFKKTHI